VSGGYIHANFNGAAGSTPLQFHHLKDTVINHVGGFDDYDIQIDGDSEGNRIAMRTGELTVAGTDQGATVEQDGLPNALLLTHGLLVNADLATHKLSAHLHWEYTLTTAAMGTFSAGQTKQFTIPSLTGVVAGMSTRANPRSTWDQGLHMLLIPGAGQAFLQVTNCSTGDITPGANRVVVLTFDGHG
jgi:hypothetical protein